MDNGQTYGFAESMAADVHALREELITVVGMLCMEVKPGQYSKALMPFLSGSLGRLMIRINAVHRPLQNLVGSHSVTNDDFDRAGPRAALLEVLMADTKVRAKLKEKQDKAKPVEQPMNDALINEVGELRAKLAKARDALTVINVRAAQALDESLPPSPASIKARARAPRPQPADFSIAAATKGTSAGQHRMLTTLAAFHPLGLTRYQLGFLARVASSSGTFSNYFSEIRPLLVDLPGKRYTVSEVTAKEYGGPDPKLQTHKGRSDRFKSAKLDAGARRMLEELEKAPGQQLDRETLGVRARVASSSGTFSNYMSRLSNCDLVITERGQPVRLHPWLTKGKVE